jgi:methionine synthase II (cobalamin-independent)
MFATVSGPLPRPPAGGGEHEPSEDELVRVVLASQEAAGLEALTDGRLRSTDPFRDMTAWASEAAPIDHGLAAWRFAAQHATRAVKQALPGPYTIGRVAGGTGRARRRATLAAAEALNEVARSLDAAGCPLIEIEEADGHAVADDRERTLFRDAHRRLTEGIGRSHLSLALVGPAADVAGAATMFDAPYASHLFDLVAGPDNWRLVAKAPAERGIVCGAQRSTGRSDGGPEMLVWAAHYAASTQGRGLDRVGLANATGLAALPWHVVEERLRRLGDAARVAALPAGPELAASLDPRAVGHTRRPQTRRRPPREGRVD